MTSKIKSSINSTKFRVFAIFICLIICLLFVFGRSVWGRTPVNTGEYGVFIGTNSANIKNIHGFSMVVIDAWELSAEDVQILHDKGCKVYSYINVGSIETSRSYYDDFIHLSLGKYENWENEDWVNVADKSWQDLMTGIVAKKIVENGADGFFVDNTDVYYEFQTDEIYQGLVNIMTGLKSYDKPVIINGGKDFVSRLIEENKTGLITGINQESVFTKVKSYSDNIFGRRKRAQLKIYQKYLKSCKDSGLDVYLLEYTNSRGMAKRVRKYCSVHGYKYFVTNSLALKWSEDVLK